MIYLGADHGGFAMKEKLKSWLTQQGQEWQDMGAAYLDHDDDYPVFAAKVAQAVGSGHLKDRGVLLCRSGGGMVIAANKFPNVRAVSCIDETMAAHGREHNNANVIVLSADFVPELRIYHILETFLATPFSQHRRHERRLAQIAEFERQWGSQN